MWQENENKIFSSTSTRSTRPLKRHQGNMVFVNKTFHSVNLFTILNLGKSGRGKKGPKEKMSDGRKKIIILRVIFRRLPTFSWEIFFTLIGFNLWSNFIRIILLNNLLMLFKVTSVYHSGSCAPKTPITGASPLGPPLISEYVWLGI